MVIMWLFGDLLRGQVTKKLCKKTLDLDSKTKLPVFRYYFEVFYIVTAVMDSVTKRKGIKVQTHQGFL